MVCHLPAHNFARVGVEHEGKIELSLPATGIRDVRNPRRSGASGTKLRLRAGPSRQGHALKPVSAGGARVSPATATADETCFSHQPRYPLPSTPDPRDAQLSMNPQSAVGFPAILVDALYVFGEHRASALALFSGGVLMRQA